MGAAVKGEKTIYKIKFNEISHLEGGSEYAWEYNWTSINYAYVTLNK